MSNMLSPNIKDGNSPLDYIMRRVLIRHGESSLDAADDAYIMMMVEFANEVIDQVKAHPYYDEATMAPGGLQYYTSQHDARPVPDSVMLAGLSYMYALQQGSSKTGPLQSIFFQTMNRDLWILLTGSAGSQRLRMRPVDGGTHKANSPTTDVNTGQITSE